MAFFDMTGPRAAVLGAAFAAMIAAPTLAQTPPNVARQETPPPALDPSTELAKVNGASITAGDVVTASEDLEQSMSSMTEAQRRDYVLNVLIDMKLVAQAAEKAKVDQTDDFKKRLEYLKDRSLYEQYLQEEAKKSLTEDKLRALYEETAKNLKPEDEVRARHILVKTEDEAKKVEARLAKGEDFAKLAGELSTDPGSGKQGGDLGFFGRGQMVPVFEEVAFKLEPGKVSEPVKSQFGWHVIKLEEKRTRPVPPFEQVRPQIENYVLRTAQQDLVLKLRNESKIDRTEAGKPAAPDAPMTPPAGGATPAPAPAPQ